MIQRAAKSDQRETLAPPSMDQGLKWLYVLNPIEHEDQTSKTEARTIPRTHFTQTFL